MSRMFSYLGDPPFKPWGIMAEVALVEATPLTGAVITDRATRRWEMVLPWAAAVLG